MSTTSEMGDLENRFDVLVQAGTPHQIEALLGVLPGTEIARLVLRLDPAKQRRLLETLSPETAARVLEILPEPQAADLLELIRPREAAAIVEELPSDEQADILRDVQTPEAEAILNEMTPAGAREARALSQYADDVAGGLMITEFLQYPQNLTAGEVVRDIRLNVERYRGLDVQYAYVVDDGGRLRGVLGLRDLLLADEQAPLRTLMRRDLLAVLDSAPLAEVRDLFEKHNFLAVPVTDTRGALLGVIRAAAVEEALAERGESDYRKSQGIVGGEELRTMPLLLRSRRRLAWLSVNILLNLIAASVIAAYQDTLAAVIALAVFLPIISDMSGCSGNQAVAVSIRELALGLLRPAEALRVLLLEISVGALNGLALGLLIAAVAWAWKGNPFLGLVAGAAMTLNTVVAVAIGGTVPLALKRLGMDAALASGPILTTITDMCGFFLLLHLASAALPYLTA